MSILISYLVLAYNHERFIEAALKAAFAQTYEPMEIIVSDDCSADGTATVIEKVIADYKGPKRIKFIRNTVNGGLAQSLNNAVSASSGEILMAAAGDDESLPQRCQELVDAFAAGDHISCVYSNAQTIDERGAFQHIYYRLPTRKMHLRRFNEPHTSIHGATAAYRRRVFDVFGPLDVGVGSEDRILALRSAILGNVEYLHQPLVRYRRHGTNLFHGAAARSRQSLEEWLAYEERMSGWLVGIFKNRLRDLDTALALFPKQRGELAAVRRKTATFLMHSQAELAMHRQPSLPTRVLLTAKVLLTSVKRPRFAWRWIKMFYLTKQYFRSIQRASASREAK